MQDSLNDYIKISKNKKEDVAPKITKETLITLQRQRECNDRALKFVEFLIEGKLRPETFLRCLRHINQSHYQDIVEERAITKICGYPICGRKLPEMPKKQYHISVKSNKVYDITDRKNYCSNFCYKASLHIKAQIETSPLWLRKCNEMPAFKLLPKTEGGLPGEEIDQGIAKPDSDNAFTSVSSFTEISLDDLINDEVSKGPRRHKKGSKRESYMQSVQEIDEDEENNTNENSINNKNVELTVSSSNAKKDLNKVKPRHPIDNLTEEDILRHLKKCVKEWITLDTYIYLHSENVVKQILNEKKLSGYFDKLKINNLQLEKQIKYMEICRKLQLKDLADEKFDKSVLNMKLKPVPDYKTLREENRNLDIKVRSFYSGVLYEADDNDSNINNDDSNVNVEDSNVSNEGPPAVLPLADVSSQNALRRKVFLSSLSKVIKTFCHSLAINFVNILSDVRSLAKTFKFQAHNVVFKPQEWNLIGIIFLKILCIKDAKLEAQLDEVPSQEYFNLMTDAFPHFNDLLGDIIDLLKNIESYVENYVVIGSSA